MTEVFNILCLKEFGVEPISLVALPKAGGDRSYWRLSLPDGQTILGVKADNLAEASAFIQLSSHFRSTGLNVPLVFRSTPDFRYYLVEDLGDISLFSILGSESDELYVKQVLSELVKMQTLPENEWVGSVVYKPFSPRQIMWDLNYFKYEFVKGIGVDFDEERLEDDFVTLSNRLMDFPDSMACFLMRDCQSRNVMMVPGVNGSYTPYFIDFQSGRKGPGIYDAVSFLWQAKAGFSNDFRARMMEYYTDEFTKARGMDKSEILRRADLFVLFRTLQVLGAYGYRGLVQRRSHFIESIPAALANLRVLVESGTLSSMPELERVSSALVACERFNSEPDSKLRIRVFSFSYKRGYPDDFSGNGGGFMFDCRGMHNPGRYDEFKLLTGLDRPVIDFLKERGEVDDFVDKAVDIVSPSVECYLRRGFNSLQIGFGCTGGRHRSVYCAQKLAEILAELYPDAIIDLLHREQSIHKIFNQNQDNLKTEI